MCSLIDSELDVTWRFEMAIQDRCAVRAEPFEWGTALFNPDLPRVYDQNLLRLERGFDEVTAPALATEADRLQRPAGLAHRKVLVPDVEAGKRLAPEFAEMRWRRARHVIMAYRRGGPAEPAHPVDVVDHHELREARTLAFEDDLGGEAAAQVAASQELAGDAVARARGFAVRADGKVVSWCVLYEQGGIGQVEDVVTAMRHRRRGFGRAVVTAAIRASLTSGNRLTFLVADDDDWPKEMYARLGFEPIGRRFEFTRT